ncbi:MAG: hypothetical protein IJD83_09880 [Clostridia bacterium]|nr:hypothetical protein [Clostridia bacterium]
MIKVLIGKKGTGKTKTLIASVTDAAANAQGDLVFISSDTKRHMYDIPHKVRMVDTSAFVLKVYDEFYGFICGLLSNNFDISHMYIDSMYKIVEDQQTGLEKFFKDIEALSNQYNIDFMFTMSMDEADAPEYLKKYL